MNSECFETVFEAVIVGAGFGGIGAAIQLKRLGYENFVILDREADLGGIQAYQGVSVPCFPNLLNLVSPYAFSGLSFFNTIEYQMRHMDRLLGEVKRRGATTFEVTEQANARFLDRMTELLGDSVFRWGNCATSRSYYFNPSGEATLLRPTSTRNAVREASTFPLRDYMIA